MHIFFSAGFIISSVFFVYALGYPQYKEIKHTRMLLDRTVSTEKEFSEFLSGYDTLNALYDSFTSKELRDIDGALPKLSPETLPLFLIDMDTFLKNYPLSGAGQSSSENEGGGFRSYPVFTYGAVTAADDTYMRMLVQINGSGTYSEIRSLLDGLSVWIKAFYITQVSINRDNSGQGPPLLTFNITGVMFFLKDPDDTIDAL